ASEVSQETPVKEEATNDNSASEASQETPVKEEATNDNSASEASQETPVKEEATNDNSASETPDYVGVNSDSLENSTLENGDDESSNDQDKDIAYTTPTEATAPRSIEPRSRVALNEAQAQKQGKNVNDLITVTNQSITEGGREDGIISAHDGENITYTTDFKIDNDVKSGDTMTVKYDPRTIPSDLTDDYTPVDIMDPSGEVIATGSFDNSNKTTTYTFTDYVDKYENVNAKLVMNSFIDKKEVPNEETVDLTFATANESINKSFNVSYQRPIVERASNIQSIFTNLDLDGNTVEQTVYVNPLSLNAQNAKVLIRGAGVYDDGGFFNGEGSTIIDNSTDIKVYKAKPGQKLPQNNRIYDYSQYEDVTNQVNIDKNYSNNQAMVDFGNINSPYIIKVKSKYTPGAEDSLAIQQGVRMTTTNDGILSYAGYTNSIISTSDQGGGNGEEAPEKTYKIGDYVWEDVDKDGVQGTDEKEKPISNVLVTLTYPDGTSKSVRTDENGHYEFDNLYDGETYQVSFETPEGYEPTKVNAGNNSELDSNGSNVSVTINGSDDMTLDSGFYKTPKYSIGDYVWLDSNKDGVQDEEENGISGVTVTLKDKNGKTLQTTQTDGKGKYRFDNLDSGDYKVVFEKPEGLTQTATNSTNEDEDADGGEVDVTITDHDDFSIDNGYFEDDTDADADSDADADADSDADKGHNDKVNSKELPDTGNENNGTLFGSLFAALGGLFLVGRRRKNKNNEEK
ncbi:TPA: fibrinogen-binding adhesin SdrG C-terminal domain-containing protein, partial [Staphylococcus aureus]|nr:fibrinogen-binding adhesin SdrG C-terminal domain-containing protein [Staphylococcus aureus]